MKAKNSLVNYLVAELPESYAVAMIRTIAVVTTAFTAISHAAVIVRRWVDPLPSDADYEWPGPRTRISSLFTLQTAGAEQLPEMCARNNIQLCRSVTEALTHGTESLAVDAVMLIGEHGDFPMNEIGQKLYPRKELLDEVLAVFDRTGRIVPLFFDKHFSWDVDSAREMYWALEDRKVPWFGGSSLPHCPLFPPIEDFQDAIIEEVVMTTWGETEAYLFHAVEILESFVEKREGGETGITTIIAWKGEQVWDMMERGEFSSELLDDALESVSTEVVTSFQDWKSNREKSIEVFQLRYRDGLKATIVRLPGIIRKWAVGCRIAGREKSIATAPVAGNAEFFYPHFARFSRRIEDFFLSQKCPVPRTRLYLTTLACAHCMQALAQPGIPLDGAAIEMPPVRPKSIPEF